MISLFKNLKRFGFSRSKDVACETSPARIIPDEVIKRYARMPSAQSVETQPKDIADIKRLSKLELNLRRFEEERHRFHMEKEKFEREKRQMEQLRFHRLLEFEKKRAVQEQQRDREQLALEAAAIAIVEIEKQRALLSYRQGRSRSRTRSYEQMLDGYESSTATTVSSRAGDFDGVFDDIVQHTESIESQLSPVDVIDVPEPLPLTNDALADVDQSSIIEADDKSSLLFPKPNTEQSFLRRMFSSRAKTPIGAQSNPRIYLNQSVDDDKPISIRRIICIEAPLVWYQVIELHPVEWQRLLLLRNRCIANFVILCILFGLGGIIFRFIEGTFEHYYKCGVRRVKRDFVDHLWASSHELRFAINFYF